MRIHRAAILIDTHNDVAMKTVKGFDISKPAAIANAAIKPPAGL